MAPADTTHRVTVQVINSMGLHARPATYFAEIAGRYSSAVQVWYDNQVVDGKSIMQMLMLAAIPGATLVIEATGPDAVEAVTALADLVNRKFDEE